MRCPQNHKAKKCEQPHSCIIFFLLPSLSKTQKINPSKKPFGPMDQPSHHLAVAASRWCIAQWKVDGPASPHQVMPPRRLPWRMAAEAKAQRRRRWPVAVLKGCGVGEWFPVGVFMILEENKELGQWKGKKGNDLVKVLGGILYTNNMISIYHW